MIRRPPRSTLFPYTTLFRSKHGLSAPTTHVGLLAGDQEEIFGAAKELGIGTVIEPAVRDPHWQTAERSEEHTSELQSRQYLVCRLLLENKQTVVRKANPLVA